jgi:hypothetical protein
LDDVIFAWHITKVAFNMAMNKMKKKCEGATWGIVLELEKWLSKHEVMIALGVVYPLFWVMNPNEMEERFYF